MTLALLTLVLQACIPGNLAEHKQTAATRVSGWSGVVSDGTLATEGSFWSGPQSAVLAPGGSITVDLGGEYDVGALVLQADNDDRYWIEASDDQESWRPIWSALPIDGAGLRTRWGQLPKPEPARWLRVHGDGGDTRYAVSELRAYCQLPPVWPPKLIAPPLFSSWDDEMWLAVKRFAAALFGCAVLLYGLRRRRRDRVFDAGLVLVAIVSCACFYSWGRFHGGRFVHIWDSYHYYVGGKYFAELGYTRLYECTAVAESEFGQRYAVQHRKQRDLVSNDLETTAATLEYPDACKEHFTPERWQQFKNDVRYFRGELNDRDWESVQSDHGFNGTPFWSINAKLLADWLPATRLHLQELAALDVLAIAVMWLLVGWACGWRIMAVAMLFWGTNHPGRYYWTGGAFLRMDWLLMLIGGLCLARKQRPIGAGVLIGLATLLRIFPGFVMGALVLRWLARGLMRRGWTVPPMTRRLVLACTLTVVAGVAVSSATFGVGSWPAFAVNSQKHLATPLTNNMGLKSIVGFSFDTRAARLRDFRLVDPFHNWKQARRHQYQARLPLFVLLLAGFCALLGRVAADEDEATTLVLGVALIVTAAELTSYYYSFMLAFAFLWSRHRLVALLLGLAALGSTWITWGLGWEDDQYIAISAAFIVFILLVFRLLQRTPREAASPL